MLVHTPSLYRPLVSLFFAALIGNFTANCQSQSSDRASRPHSGNPVFPGWYADPEGEVFGKTFWIFPTYSAPYDQQTFFDAFSSPDLVNWTKHRHVFGTNTISWAHRAMWAPSVVENRGHYFFFFGANDIQNNQQTGGIGVAIADQPEGPY